VLLLLLVLPHLTVPVQNNSYAYILVTAPDYPERTAGKFLTEYMKSCPSEGEMGECIKEDSASTRDYKAGCKALMTAYDDLQSVDQAAAMLAKVEGVKSTMNDSIQTALSNADDLDSLNSKTDDMREDALGFKKKAVKAKRGQWWKNMKLNLIIGSIVLIVVGCGIYSLWPDE